MEDPSDLDLAELAAADGTPPPADAVSDPVSAGQEQPRTGADLEAVYDVPVQVSPCSARRHSRFPSS